ncbi:MAG: hypothetical protein AAGF33_00810 [Pseudomonadota bacterium]
MSSPSMAATIATLSAADSFDDTCRAMESLLADSALFSAVFCSLAIGTTFDFGSTAIMHIL